MYHEGLTRERWQRFPLTTQLLMIATELKRLHHWLVAGERAAALSCMERAHELFDLTVGTVPEGRRRRELCRAREILRGIPQNDHAADEARMLTRIFAGDL